MLCYRSFNRSILLKPLLAFLNIFFSGTNGGGNEVGLPIDLEISPPDSGVSLPIEEPVELVPIADGGIYSFTWNWGSAASIADFNVMHDQIDLTSFWSSYAAFEIYDNQDGSAVIDLANLNHQSITIENVTSAELSGSHFIGVSGEFNDALSHADAQPDPVVEEDPPEDTPLDPLQNTAGEVYAYTGHGGIMQKYRILI